MQVDRERVAANEGKRVLGLVFDVDARHVETSVRESLRCTAGRAADIERAEPLH